MKRILQLLAFGIFGFIATGNAQFNDEWHLFYQHCTANNFSNESRKVVADAAGNAYVLADVTSNKDILGNTTTSTWHYTVLSKYSPTGALLFSTSIKVFNHIVNGFDMNGAFGMEIDASNNIYIGYLPYDQVKNFDVAIAKYNSSLTLQWTRVYNSTAMDVGVDMGLVNGTVYALVKCVSGGSTTYRVIQANGNVINDTAIYSFTTNTDVLNSIKVQSGVIYVAGYRLNGPYKDALAIKINNAGSLKWTITYDGGLAGDDYGKDITIGVDGNIYVTGSSWRGVPRNFDIMLMKITAAGINTWNRFRDNSGANDVGLFVDAPDIDYAYMGATSGNNLILQQIGIGTVAGASGGKAVYTPIPVATHVGISGVELYDFKVSTNHGFYLSGSVIATDNLGRLFSAQCLVKYVFSGPSQRDAFNLDSAMPVDGDFANTMSGGSIAMDYFNSDIFWLTDKVSDNSTHNQESVGIRELSMLSPAREAGTLNTTVAAGETLITPNPAKDVITLTSAQKITKIELFDLTGKTVKSITTGSQKVTLDISGLMNGIYIGKIYTEQGTVISRKIIKN